MSDERPTKISEDTPVNTNLRMAALCIAGVAVAGWYSAMWLGSLSNKLDNHAAAIASINDQLADVKRAQEQEFSQLMAAIQGRRREMPDGDIDEVDTVKPQHARKY